KTRSHWVAIANKKEHLDRLLHPVRWKNDPAQAMLLAPALVPVQAMTGLGTASSTCYALYGAFDHLQAKEEKKTGDPTVRSAWMRISTQERLKERLEKAEAEVARLEAKASDGSNNKEKEDAEKDLKGAKNKVEKLQTTMAAFKRVGVWTDDYSNLLSVFKL